MPLTTHIALTLKVTLTGQPTDLVNVTAPINISQTLNSLGGSGSNQANNMFADTRTLAPSAEEDLHLTGNLTNGLGQIINLTHVHAIYVKAHTGNTNNVLVGDWETNPTMTDHVPVQPGGTLLLLAPEGTGYDITSNDSLHITNSGSGTPVTYDLVVIGR
jgi:hypothetical protein